jgi:hypothetical protein
MDSFLLPGYGERLARPASAEDVDGHQDFGVDFGPDIPVDACDVTDVGCVWVVVCEDFGGGGVDFGVPGGGGVEDFFDGDVECAGAGE